MTLRALLLADGPSDAPLGGHVAHLAREHGVELDVVSPDLRRLEPPPGLRVADRIQSVFRFDSAFDLIIVHRDAEGRTTDQRLEEVRAGIADVQTDLPFIPIVPIRMTEAWLLVDETAIRLVAGRPHGTEPLNLPALADVERVPDPKQLLQRTLEVASGVRGRRLRSFQRDFGAQRRRLLETLDCNGPVTRLHAWQELVRTVGEVVSQL